MYYNISDLEQNTLAAVTRTHIVNDLRANLDVNRVSQSVLLTGQGFQLIVEIDPVHGVQWCAVRFFDVAKVVRHQDVHGSAVEKASGAYGDHSRGLDLEVPGSKDAECVGGYGDGRTRFVK